MQMLSGTKQVPHIRDSGGVGVVGRGALEQAGQLMPHPERTAVIWRQPIAARWERGTDFLPDFYLFSKIKPCTGQTEHTCNLRT